MRQWGGWGIIKKGKEKGLEMKKRGSVVEHREARDRELHARFLEVLREGEVDKLSEMYGEAARRPCSRFWVSEMRAAVVLGTIRRNGEEAALAGMEPKRREMYLELWRRVKDLMGLRPGLCLTHAVVEVVNGGAPEFYITEKSAKILIYKEGRRRRASISERKGGEA